MLIKNRSTPYIFISSILQCCSWPYLLLIYHVKDKKKGIYKYIEGEWGAIFWYITKCVCQSRKKLYSTGREKESRKKQRASSTDRKKGEKKKKELSFSPSFFSSSSSSYIDSFQSFGRVPCSRSEDYHYDNFY